MNLDIVKNLDQLMLVSLTSLYLLIVFIFITVKATGWLSLVKVDR